jgi:hypothetical protein
MAITPSEFVRMLLLWEQCCSDTGEGWIAAAKEMRSLEEKAGIDMPMNYTDFEGFHVAVLGLIHAVA